jgi:hypothetical protein
MAGKIPYGIAHIKCENVQYADSNFFMLLAVNKSDVFFLFQAWTGSWYIITLHQIIMKGCFHDYSMLCRMYNPFQVNLAHGSLILNLILTDPLVYLSSLDWRLKKFGLLVFFLRFRWNKWIILRKPDFFVFSKNQIIQII